MSHEDEHDSVHLPEPSFWPFVLGGGLALAFFGVATSWFFIAFGAVLVIWALFGWIEDLRGRRGHPHG